MVSYLNIAILKFYRRVLMKKLLLNIAFASTMALGSITTVFAETCIQFTGFCDGLEISVNNGQISGTWKNWDCAGSNVPVQGNIKNGNGRVACSGGCLNGDRFGWIAETTLDGTMDMYIDPGAVGNPQIFIDELAYTTSLGTCSFNLFDGGGIPSAAQ
jgi:hypothetical protein